MKVALLGCGVVGKEVRRILDEREDVEIVSILVKDEKEIDDERMTTSFEELLNKDDMDIVVECMGGIEPAFSYVKKAMLHHKHIVTSNKKMLANHYLELSKLAKENQVSLRYEASVGGGIPWIHEMHRVQRIDKIQRFYGIMNGTTNYILTQFEEGESFEKALKNAQMNGFAEQDPTDDIDGYDVRYKCMLSAITSFHIYLEEESIPVYGIRNISDKEMKYANQKNQVIKLMGNGYDEEGNYSIYVIPTLLPKTHPLSIVKNETNGLFMKSTTLSESGYIGKGAGGTPTAHAVVQDVLSIPSLEDDFIQGATNALTHTGRFYIRMQELDNHCAFISETINENTILSKEISLQTLYDYTKGNTNILFVMEVLQ